MMFFSKFTSMNWGMVVSSMFLVFLLQGCETPLVDVKVTTHVGECDKLDGETDEDGGVGLCRARRYSGDAEGFWNMDTQKVIEGSGLTCSAAGSRKCRNDRPCINATGEEHTCTTNYTDSPQRGSCFCGCGRLPKQGT